MNNNRCITNLLKYINLLQINSVNTKTNITGCNKPYLGPSNNSICYNTRPINIYTKNGTMLESTYTFNNNTFISNVYRIQKINNNCITLLILGITNDNQYFNTNSYITINTNCICAVKCLDDTIVDNICNN